MRQHLSVTKLIFVLGSLIMIVGITLSCGDDDDNDSTTTPTTNLTFDDVDDFAVAVCATSGCHNGAQPPNLTTHQGWIDNAADSLREINEGSMPDASNSQAVSAWNAEASGVANVKEWLAAGAP